MRNIVFVSFIWFSEQGDNISICSISRFFIITDMENVYCPVRTDALQSVYSHFHTGRSMAQADRPKHLNAKAWVRFKEIRSGYVVDTVNFVIGFFLSTSVLPCQYYSAHALYSSSFKVVRTRRTNVQCLETLKKNALSEINNTVKPISSLAQWRILIFST